MTDAIGQIVEDHARAAVEEAPRRIEGAVGAVTSTWHRAIDPLTDLADPEHHSVHGAIAAFGAVGSLLSLPTDLIDAAAAGLSSLLPSAPLPALCCGSSTLHVGLPHAHPPRPPMPSLGLTMLVGSLSVQLGGAPALRCGDLGAAPTCLSLFPLFKVFTGSSSVFIGGKRAVRMGDLTWGCLPSLLPAAAAGASVAVARISIALQIAGRVTLAAGTLSTVGTLARDIHSAATTEDASTTSRVAQVAGIAAQIVQTGADIALAALSTSIGADPGVPGGPGLTLGLPARVLIGGMSMPEAASLMDAAQSWLERRGQNAPRPCSFRGAIVGEPVDAVTGRVFADHVDVDLGEGLSFTRHYDTRDKDRVGDCGRGTRHGWERELEVWLHRCSYVDHEGTRVDFPAFRGRRRVALAGYAIEKIGAGRYEVSYRGETMGFTATDGVRHARLDFVRTEATTRTLEHDSLGRVRSVHVGSRGLTLTRDAEGLVVAVHDERGRLRASYAYARECLIAARDAEGREERFEHDDAPRLVGWEDARGHRFSWRYDDEGRCIYTGGSDDEWSYELAYERGRTIVTHASGLRVTYHYDAYGDVLRVVRSDGGFLLREKDARGRVVRERDAGGRVVDWIYDADDAHVARRDRFGNDLPPESTELSARDGLSRSLTRRLDAQLGAPGASRGEAPSFPASLASLAAWAIPAIDDGREIRSIRDALGRVVRLVDARGSTTEIRHDAAGNVIEITDRDGSILRAQIGGWRSEVTAIDAIGRRTEWTRTPTEEVRSYRDPGGCLTEHGRDAADRMVSTVRDGRLIETYAYDTADRLIEKRDADGALLLRITYGENALPATVTLAEGAAIALAYDAHGRVTRATSGDNDARIERDRDRTVLFDRLGDRGLRRWRTEDWETVSLFERFETRITRAADRRVVRDPTGGVTTFEGCARGRLSRTLANGTREILAFDPEGRLEGRLAHRTAHDGAIASWAARYERSSEGDLLSLWDTARGERRFEVDAAHRLEGEIDERGERHAFLHDANDHLLVRGAEHAADGTLVTNGDAYFEHDARGRMLCRRDRSGRTRRFHYDSLDQLVRVELEDGRAWRASYDGIGRLRCFGVEARATTLYWDGDRIAAEVAWDGALRIHVYAEKSALIPFAFVDYASEQSAPQSGSAFFVFHDASGMPIQIEDASGRTVWWADRIDPYGEVTLHESSEVAYALRWPGHLFDAEIGLHHNRFRVYDPRLGRYLQPDPIGHDGSPHGLYAYAPNPLVAVDLLGLHTGTDPQSSHGRSEPTEGHPPQPQTLRNCVGRLYDALTGRYASDPNAPNAITIRRTRRDVSDGHEVRLDPHDSRVHALLETRRTELERARVARQRGDEHEAHVAQARANKATEGLGALAARAEVENRYPDAELMHEDDGAGTFDAVYQIHGPPPQTLVVEAKGGSARESSSRQIGSDRAQQGTPEYRKSVADEMAARAAATNNPRMAAAAAAVQESGDATIYIGVRQPIRSDGGLGTIRVSEYGSSVRASDGTISAPAGARAPPPRRPRRAS